MSAAGWMIHGVAPLNAVAPADAPRHGRVVVGDLLALTGEAALTGDAAQDAAVALRHNDVLAAYAAVGPVAPARFGAVAADADAAAAAVARDAPRWREALARIGDAVELGARLVEARPWGRAAAPAPPCAANYLRAKAAERDAARRAAAARAAAAETLSAALRAHARAARAFTPRPAPAGAPRRLAELALLAPRAGLHAFRARAAALGAVAGEHGVALEITGPWPAYSFVETEHAADAHPA